MAKRLGFKTAVTTRPGVLVGPKASPLQLVLNTAYHIDRSPGMVPYTMYEGLSGPDYRRNVRLAVPFAVTIGRSGAMAGTVNCW